MNIIKGIKMKFGCRWKYLENPPGWIDTKARMTPPETIRELRGKNFVYKIVRGTPKFQGDYPVTFYKRLRYSAWLRMQRRKK